MNQTVKDHGSTDYDARGIGFPRLYHLAKSRLRVLFCGILDTLHSRLS